MDIKAVRHAEPAVTHASEKHACSNEGSGLAELFKMTLRSITSTKLIFLSLVGGFQLQYALAGELQSAITIQDIVELREFSGVDVCPARKLIAARLDDPDVTGNRVRHLWKIIEWPSGKIRTSVDAGDSIITFGLYENIRPQWSKDCQWIYYRARHDDEVQIWRLKASTGTISKITSDDADIQDFSLIENGQALVYKTGASRADIAAAETREYHTGVLYDEIFFPLHPPLTKAFPISGRWSNVRWWNNSTRGHLLSRQPPTYKVMTILSGETRVANETEISKLTEVRQDNADWLPNSASALRVSRGGEHAVAEILTKRYRQSGEMLSSRLVSVARENPSNVRVCTSPYCEGENLVFLNAAEDWSTIYFISEQTRGAAGIYAWSLNNDKVRLILETEGVLGALASGARYQSGACPIMANTAFCTIADHGSPPRLIAISLSTGKIAIVLDPNFQLRQKFALKTKRIRWTDKFDRQALGILVYPKNYTNGVLYPLVITTYRCRGFLNGGIADGGPEYVLAENGFLVVCIDHNHDLPPIDATAKYSPGPGRYVAALSEYESAIDFLAQKGLADRRRVGITGTSMSANAVSYALSHSEKFHVASTRALGIWSLGSEMLSAHPYSDFISGQRKIHNITEGGENAETIYKDLSLTRRTEHFHTPILVQASDSEYLKSLPAVNALLKLKKPIEMHVFPKETHFLHQPAHRFANYERNLDWVRFWLQGNEDPNPEKSPQYERWRKLCAGTQDHYVWCSNSDRVPK